MWRAATRADTVQAAASRAIAVMTARPDGQALTWGADSALRTAALAGDTFQASAATTAPVVHSIAAAGWRITGGLHSAPTAEPTSRQISVAISPPASTANVAPISIVLALVRSTPSLPSAQPMPPIARMAPTSNDATSAASWARRGPPPAATQARAAPGSAVSIDRVSQATAGTSIRALQLSPSPSPAPPALLPPPRPTTVSPYSTSGGIHRCDRSSNAT